MGQIDISIIIPTYNRGRFLPEAIDCALSQQNVTVQVIVVDDGSTDDTAAIAQRYEKSIQYICQKNAGPSAARNNALQFAIGEAVLFLDSDDYLPLDASAHHLGVLENGCEVSFGEWSDVDVEGRLLRNCHIPDLGNDPFHALLRRNGFACHAAAIRRDALNKVGGFNPKLWGCEDWDLWLRLAGSGARFKGCHRHVASYRKHASTLSGNYRRMWNDGKYVIESNARLHERSCAQCAESVAIGLKHWRRWCVEKILAPELKSLWPGRAHHLACRLADLATSDPMILSCVAQKYVTHLKWRLLRR